MDASSRKCTVCDKSWKHFVRRPGNVGIPYCSLDCASVGEALAAASLIEAKRSRVGPGGGDENSEASLDRLAKRAAQVVNPNSSEFLAAAIDELRRDSDGALVDPVPVEAPLNAPGLDQLIGLAEEKSIIRRKLVAILSVPEIAARAGLFHDNLLLYGPGGTGKTALIVALAKELNYCIIQVRRSDVLSEWKSRSTRQLAVFTLGARMLAARIQEGKFTRFAGVLLFFDEADALFADHEGSETEGLTAEFKARVSEVGVPRLIIAAATNFPNKIRDSGVLRRFGTKLYFGLPTAPEAFETARRLVLSYYEDTTRKGCYSSDAGDPGFVRRLLQGMEDQRAAKQITELVRGHTPAEIGQMVRAALGPRTGDLRGQQFVRLSKPERWMAVDSTFELPRRANAPDNVNLTDGRTLDITLSSGMEKGIAVCWPVPLVGDFIRGLEAAAVKRSVSESELRGFYEYATFTLVDPVGAERIRLALEELRGR